MADITKKEIKHKAEELDAVANLAIPKDGVTPLTTEQIGNMKQGLGVTDLEQKTNDIIGSSVVDDYTPTSTNKLTSFEDGKSYVISVAVNKTINAARFCISSDGSWSKRTLELVVDKKLDAGTLTFNVDYNSAYGRYLALFDNAPSSGNKWDAISNVKVAELSQKSISELDKDVKALSLSCEKLPIVSGKACDSSQSSGIVKIDTNSGYNMTNVRVNVGDVISIKGMGANAYKLWCTVDDHGVVKRRCSIIDATTNNEVVTIEDGETAIYINYRLTYTGAQYALRVGMQQSFENVNNAIYKGTNLVNYANVDFEASADARNSVPKDIRKKGLVVSYTINGSVITEQYIGNYPQSSTWAENSYWIEKSSTYRTVINVGGDSIIKTLRAAYLKIATQATAERKFEVHIYGRIVETEALTWNKPHIDIIGHNAIVEYNGPKGCSLTFSDPSNGTLGISVKDVKFTKTGCFNYWSDCVVFVKSNDIKFYNCTFENLSSTARPYNQADHADGDEDTNGAGRRHGIEVLCDKYGAECKTEFYNCIGIGSPYGTNSCRGWYITWGSAKLFNCIGIGGGIGIFGHGLLSHRGSQASLFNCIGYGSKRGYCKAAGIRYQAGGMSQLVGCVGYASNGEKIISNGISLARLNEVAASVGITDTSFYVSGGSVNYDGLTIKDTDDGYNESRIKLGCALSYTDVDYVNVGANNDEGYGISFWANGGKAKLVDCIGYIGSGNNSHALHVINEAEPTIIGGYFGAEDIMSNTTMKEESDGYARFVPSGINDYTPYTIVKVIVSAEAYNPINGDKLYIETNESAPKLIVDGYDMKKTVSIGHPTIIEDVVVPSGVKLRAYVKNGGTLKKITGNVVLLHIVYNFAQNAPVVDIEDNAKPTITNATIKANSISDAVVVGEGVSDIAMYGCKIRGTLSDGVTFKSPEYIGNSSNYR